MVRFHKAPLYLALVACLIGLAIPAMAQERQAQHIFTPMASQKAAVSQTFGVTDVSVHYHRPAVNEREVWGGLVPYGQVWRTGANENTVFKTSTEIQVEGQTLGAGTYGLHTIPGEGEWTVIFSKVSTAWGSYTYSEEDDALRVTVKSAAAPHQERMAFTFEDVSNEGTTLTLRWDELAVPVRITADTHQLALASFREQLNGLAQYFWQGWNQAATYSLRNDVELEQGLEWAERSVQTQATFSNLATQADLLEKLGRGDETEAIMERAVEKGNAGELYSYGRSLINDGEKEKALAVMKRNVKVNSGPWFVEFGLAFAQSALGQFDEAAASMKSAHEKAPDNRKAMVEGLVARLEKGEDING